MGEIVNLRQARKRRKRDETERSAAESRARSSLSKAAKTIERTDRARREALLDGAALDRRHQGEVEEPQHLVAGEPEKSPRNAPEASQEAST
ncbi:DUF4169 family protein [Jiella sp. MQZ9-1]|uniref:DUF4169 family protein n=1 Tax=Jiella flava TaxID=2816857 RepID=A0A939JQT7_9HYPH|nr:DUF4169 family protein [Jiella flava]MBO0661218.1 DUF4169 family protein [Jiella flava]MCD2469863.1 DUF4169 family protein [Jiella flava]